jgi:hypothetical protein
MAASSLPVRFRRRLLKNDVATVFADHDEVVTPTATQSPGMPAGMSALCPLSRTTRHCPALSRLIHGGLLRRQSGEACRLRSSRVARYLHNASIPAVARKNAGDVTS